MGGSTDGGGVEKTGGDFEKEADFVVFLSGKIFEEGCGFLVVESVGV